MLRAWRQTPLIVTSRQRVKTLPRVERPIDRDNVGQRLLVNLVTLLVILTSELRTRQELPAGLVTRHGTLHD
jgi:hypothetical protein